MLLFRFKFLTFMDTKIAVERLKLYLVGVPRYIFICPALFHRNEIVDHELYVSKTIKFGVGKLSYPSFWNILRLLILTQLWKWKTQDNLNQIFSFTVFRSIYTDRTPSIYGWNAQIIRAPCNYPSWQRYGPLLAGRWCRWQVGEYMYQSRHFTWNNLR